MEVYFNKLRTTKIRLTNHKPNTIKEEMAVFQTIEDDLMPDVYGQGKVIEDFQNLLCAETHKEAAVFFPSGTMAQQIAMRMACDEKQLNKIAYHPLCHLEIHEEDGIKKLHLIEPILIGEKNRLFTMADLKTLPQVSAILFELPQREIGGQLPTWEALIEMTTYCKENNIHCHLDGARLYECLPYFQKSASDVCELFDSVYISFYKGFGGVSGAMLLGNKDFINTSKIWKRRHGGDLYHLYPYIVTAVSGFNKRKDWMSVYHNNAKNYAEQLSKIKGLTIVPQVPVTNMFHIHFDTPVDTIMSELLEVMEKYGVALMGNIIKTTETTCKAEITIGDQFGLVEKTLMADAISYFKDLHDRLPCL